MINSSKWQPLECEFLKYAFKFFFSLFFTLFEKQGQRSSISWFTVQTSPTARPKLGAGTQSRSPTWVAGTQVFRPAPAPPRVYICKKNSEVEPELRPRHSPRGCRCPKCCSKDLSYMCVIFSELAWGKKKKVLSFLCGLQLICLLFLHVLKLLFIGHWSFVSPLCLPIHIYPNIILSGKVEGRWNEYWK